MKKSQSRSKLSYYCIVSLLAYIFACYALPVSASVTVTEDQTIASKFTRHTVTGITTSLPQSPDVTGFPGASYLTIGDIDNDGIKEIICTSGVGLDGDIYSGGETGAIAIFKRNGSGLDSWTQAVINQTFAFPNETVLRDMDGDGDLDIMVMDNFIVAWLICGRGGIYWLENYGGDITQATNWAKHIIYQEPDDLGPCPCPFFCAGGSCLPTQCNTKVTSYHRARFIDLDGDGLEDFVTTKNHMWYWQWTSLQYTWMEWFKKLPSGGYAGPYQIGDGGGFLFEMADIDNDGDLDIAAPQFFIYNAGFVRKSPGDPDGDSLIWFENPGTAVLTSTPNVGWNRYTIDNEWTSPNSIGKSNEAIFSDIDDDGALEIVVTNHDHQQYSSYSGTPLRYWPAGVYYFEIPSNPKGTSQWTPITIETGDPNLDPNDHAAVLADVYGVDRDFNDYNGQGSPGMVRAQDISGDGFPELLVPGDGKGKLYYYESSGSTSSNLKFKRAALYADPGCMPGEAKFDDIDNDGDIDVVAAIYDTRSVKDLNLPTNSASVFIFEKHEPCNNIPAALETITADDGSTWERVNLPGFGNKYNVGVVALAPFQGALYALTRNDQTGFELWKTTCDGWTRVTVPEFTQNDYYGWLKPGFLNPIDRKFNLKQNTWGDMIEYKGNLYVVVSSGYQGAQLYGSIGFEIWRFDGEYWLPVVSKSVDTEATGTITAISSCVNNDGTNTATFTDSTKNWTTDQWAGGVLEVTGTFSDGTKGLRRFNIVSNTKTVLTVQENEIAGTNEYTICTEHKITCDPGRPAYNVPAIAASSSKYTIMKGIDESGFGEMWNKSIVDFEIFNDELYATIGLNYENGTRIWKTLNGTTWNPTSNYSFGLFHGYDQNGNPSTCLLPGNESRNGSPVCSSSTKLGKSDVSGTLQLYTGGTGSTGCNGRGARVLRLDGSSWNFLVDYFEDENTTGTNENGFGVSDSLQNANFQAWSWTEYDNRLFVSVVRFLGGRVMYTETGSEQDGAWIYAMGGDYPGLSDGFGDCQNIGSNLYTYKGALYAGSIVAPNFCGDPPPPANGADIWKGTGPGNDITWTRVTGNGFGDTTIMQFEAFTEYNGNLYVAASNLVPSSFWGEEQTGYGGAKIYRLVTTAECGNGIIEQGEQCEADSDCASQGSGWTCVDCQCQPPASTTTTTATTTTTVEPTVIGLVSFEASGKLARIILNWETASEIDNMGFNIYRAESTDGEYTKINGALIPAKGSATEGASYSFVDWSVEKGKTYYYKLEDIDRSGIATLHGPASAAAKSLYMMMFGK
jgi:hypothetical protein